MGSRKVEEISLTKKMYGWSKYGGARKGIVQEDLDEWYCNLCGTKLVKPLTVYFMAETAEEREFYKLCGRCRHQAIINRIDTFTELLAAKVENLLSLPSRY